jgi:hypothetical protein
MNPIPCSVCSESGHHARRCPQLSAPLQPGFFAPSGGGGHSHDDEDEKIKKNNSLKKHFDRFLNITATRHTFLLP